MPSELNNPTPTLDPVPTMPQTPCTPLNLMARPPSEYRHGNGRLAKMGGFSLIEVLVAILLISIGLLGIAGLAGSTLSYNKTSQVRLTGLALANNYADHARLNLYGYDLDKYEIDLDDTVPTIPGTDLEQTNEKTAAENVAATDVANFMNTVAALLPSGKAIVVSNRTAAERGMDIWLLWKEPQTEDGDALFTAGQQNCPKDLLSSDEEKVYSCMYFRVGL